MLSSSDLHIVFSSNPQFLVWPLTLEQSMFCKQPVYTIAELDHKFQVKWPESRLYLKLGARILERIGSS